MKLDLLIEGAFSAPSSIEEEVLKKLLLINGAAAMYSIASSKVEGITAMTFQSGKLELPMVNIINFYQSRENTWTAEKNKIENIKILYLSLIHISFYASI